MENYLVTLRLKLRKPLIQIKTRNHRLPIETRKWLNIPREERICNLCNDKIGDEFYFILECWDLKDLRRKYLKDYSLKKINVLKFHDLFNTENKKELLSLSHFISEIISLSRVN